MNKENVKRRVRKKIQRLLNEGIGFEDDEKEDDEEDKEHPQKVDKRKGIDVGDEDGKMILFDNFVEGLVSSLKSYDVSSLNKGKLSDTIQNHSLKKMFQADGKDEYYNYKTRLKKADDIASQVMNHIQNNEDEKEVEPKFVDYDNVSYGSQLAEKMDSKSHKKLMDMVYEYKKKKREDEDKVEEFFWGKPDRLKEKIKRIGENMSMGKVREYCGDGEHNLPKDKTKEDIMNEFRGKIQDKVREYFEEMGKERDILEDFE